MIRIEFAGSEPGGSYHAMIYGEVDNGIVRRRVLGMIALYLIGDGAQFHAYVPAGEKNRMISTAASLPSAIEEILHYHRLTDYQFAPWPSIEEDEEE